MFKQHILSAVVALLSTVIVFGGWLLTNELLNRQHLTLMNTVHSISVKEPTEADISVEPAKVTLSTQQISDILEVMKSGYRKYYHDPYDEQLTMEEAIRVAKSDLSYFCDKGILPLELLESSFTQTNAFLYDLQSIKQEAVPVPVVVEKLSDAAYSFWSVQLSNRDISVELTLNALTGQIWIADINSYTPNINFDDIKALEIIKEYEAYLGLTGGSELRSDDTFAFKSYDNHQIGIMISKKTDKSRHYNSLHISLTSTP